MNPQFMPQFAPLVVLMFLGTCFALFLAALVFLIGIWRRKWALARWTVIAACAVAGIYLVLLLGASVTSEEKTLSANGRKYFCEIDCHIAYSIESVTTARAVGAAPQETTASGTFYIVKVRTRFDENTISNRRPQDLPLIPNLRRVAIVDDQGREYEVSAAGLAALRHAEANWSPLTAPLRPGESYTTDLVFDLPAGIQHPRLLIADADPVTRFLIGHENSPLHKRILFGLQPRSSSATL